TDGLEITKEILYFPAGSGNDFARELGTDGNPVVITQYLNNLPSVEVNGRRYRFINGVGFGIDGYCCQVGDELKKTPSKKVNYAAIAIKGLLFHFAARNAKVTVDGKEYAYKKVWIAPTMHGHYYGGGMIPTPEQDRSSGALSLMLFHSAGRFRTLCVFPGIFKGTHVKHKNMVAVHTGHEITVEFDRPTPLQIDGETILDVTKYTASAAVCNMNKTKEKVLC
ncbi:MAG: diacylglycerol kinase family protein, partial [Oscillospiraceae bacterium]|nr:diacylglycerol kinase family protein [Oscillospiraceae bacterium]